MEIVRAFEDLAALSARLRVPGCMILRANRLFSPAWLLPGRAIEVPEKDFCLHDAFPCPVWALHQEALSQPVVLGERAEDTM